MRGVTLLCEILQHGCTLTSFFLERCLSQLHSGIYSTFSSLTRETNQVKTASDRAWWDTRKGSAVVIWASGDQSLSQALSISLASIRAKMGSKRAGRPPYTVIVLLPSASWELSSIISAWATRKARIESGKEGSRGRDSIASWHFFGLQSLSIRVGSPESQTSDSIEQLKENSQQQQHGGGSGSNSEGRSSPGSQPSTPGKKRRLSFGGWNASDVFGYGKDMLKGLQIGQTESPGIGAVIPVVADTSTVEGINHAHSTIRAYCTSHDLLLRAVVILPSIMSGNNKNNNKMIPLASSSSLSTSPSNISVRLPRQSQTTNNSSNSRSREVTSALEIEQQQISSSLSKSAKSLHGTQASLATDVGEAINVVASLVPALKTDGGRVIALVPTSIRGMTIDNENGMEDDDDDGLQYNITKIALLEMWSGLRKKLSKEGVQVSQIHMSAAPARSKATKLVGKLHSSSAPLERKKRLQRLIRQFLHSTHSILYPSPKSTFTKSYVGPSLDQEQANDDLSESCPPLLLETVRSVLIRSWPRAHHCVGLGPRLEHLWECIPGHQSMQDMIQSVL